MRVQYVLALMLSVTYPQDSSKPSQPSASALPPRFDPKTMRAPVPLFTPEAQMPDEARQSGKQGMCLMALTIDLKGVPKYPYVAGCSDPIFAANSLAAGTKYRFKPAETMDGKPIEVMVALEVRYSMGTSPWTGKLEAQIRYGLFSPPGMTSLGPDAGGIYPLSKQMEPPRLTTFVDKGFGSAALAPRGIGCHAVLTIDGQGKPSDVNITDCDRADLQKPAAESLLESKYKPAMLNGKAVAVRVKIHIIYDGFGPFQKVTPL